MPRDMSNNGGKKSAMLNLDALGDAANETVNFGSNDKPALTEEVEATIVNTELRRMNDVESYRDDPSKKFFKVVLSIETEFSYKEDGKTKTAHSRDNYSGLRYIPKMDDQGNILYDATGEPEFERFWLGETSDCGKLMLVAQEYDSKIRSYSDFFNFVANHEKCVIMTEQRHMAGKTIDKEVIQRFI